MRFDGIQIIVSPDFPRYQLPLDVPVPDAFRAKFNTWAREFFGVWCPVRDGEILRIGGNRMVMSERTYQKISTWIQKL